MNREATEAGLAELLQRVELAGQHQRAARARQAGAHQVELAALEHLWLLGDITPGELGRRLGLTSGGVTALAERLIAAGHVARGPHPRDRRMRILAATPAGAAYAAEQIEPVLAPARTLPDWLSDSETALVERILRSLAALKEQAAAATPDPAPARSAAAYPSALLM